MLELKRYFKAASWNEEIRGIEDMRLNSSPIQAPNQEEDEMERRIPNDKEEKNKIYEEESKIKKRGG